MNSEFLDLCKKNKIERILLRDFLKFSQIERLQNDLGLDIIETKKKFSELEKTDLDQIDLVYLDQSNDSLLNFEYILEHILNLEVKWVWIPNLRISDYSDHITVSNPEIDKLTKISLKNLVHLVENNTYSVSWAKSTCGESVKNLLLKKF
jgi:hypothetical protein